MTRCLNIKVLYVIYTIILIQSIASIRLRQDTDPNVIGIARGGSNGTTNISIEEGSAGTTNVNAASSNLASDTSSARANNEGTGSTDISGDGRGNTTTTGDSAAIILANGAASSNTDSGATNLAVREGEGQSTANTTSSSNVETEFGVGNTDSSGRSNIRLISGSTGGTNTTNTGRVDITDTSASNTNTNIGSANLSTHIGGSTETHTRGNTSIASNGLRGGTSNSGSTNTVINGRGSGNASTSGNGGTNINITPSEGGGEDNTENTPNTNEPIFWGYDIIPEHFWVNNHFQWGKDFVVFKGKSGFYLSCDCNGDLSYTRNTQLSYSNLWTVVQLKDSNKIITLRSYYGGYLTIDGNKVSCKSRSIIPNSIIEILHTQDSSHVVIKFPDETTLGELSNGMLDRNRSWSNQGNLWTGPFSLDYIQNDRNTPTDPVGLPETASPIL